MSVLLTILLAASTIVSLVCWIMVLIKIFKENVGLGILGVICGLFAFIYGWVKVKQYDCQKVMVAWTISTVVAILANLLGGATVFHQMMGPSGTGA